MTELSFAKSFLSTLDSRAIKLQPDHAADLKTLELKGPYTLPRYPSSPTMQPPSTASQQSQPSANNDNKISITLRSLKSPPLNLTLPSQSVTTSIFELKQKIAKEIQRDSTDGIKVLYQRKPCSDAKTVGEVVGEEGAREMEFGVMVVGLSAAGASAAGGEDVKMGGVEEGKGKVPAAQGQSGEEVLGSAEFWDDLKGWLMQRVRDEGKADEVWSLFKRGWDER
ncbi:MAG: hypothetical protein L6R42_006344 [Xanthoria sp. 1 TBL-2021]|nr:MAG: hypothetical protein L6R42_006344 [Xanthoria sp. 1 TBL-2021]